VAERPEVLVREIEDELVILDRERGVVHQLNGTATLVWKRCDGERSVRDIAVELARVYDVSVDTAERDVETTVLRLAELHLLAGVGGEGLPTAPPQGDHHG
jgi:hypothetical protein